jgi:ABC-2 type transport system ATP-binding protein
MFPQELDIFGEPLIDITHLYKYYDKKPVLTDVNLSVRRGSVMGLLGPNGAGKTTLISILAGIINKESGSITIGGMDLDRDLKAIQSKCSYIPQSFAFYPRLTARENLEYFGALWGLKGKNLKERMEFCIDIGSMQTFVNKRVDKFSGGMKRRLNLAIGLLHDPEILYLDEPTVGVDTHSRGYILETIKKINLDRQVTVIYSSHYMDEIEQVSDDIAVINEGKIILHEDTQAILTCAGGAGGHGTLEEFFLKLTNDAPRDEE